MSESLETAKSLPAGFQKSKSELPSDTKKAAASMNLPPMKDAGKKGFAPSKSEVNTQSTTVSKQSLKPGTAMLQKPQGSQSLKPGTPSGSLAVPQKDANGKYIRPQTNSHLMTQIHSKHDDANTAADMRKHWEKTMQEDHTRERFALMLKRLKLFRDSSPAFLEDVCRKLAPHEFDVGEKIMNQGDFGDWLCINLKGVANVVVNMGPKNAQKAVTVGEFRPGKYIGEMAMLGISLKRTASIVVTKPTLVLSLTRDDLEDVLDNHEKDQIKWEHVLYCPLHIDQNDLSETKFFCELSSTFLDRIQKHLQVKVFFTEDYLMKEGEYGSEMYILRRGTVGIFVGKKHVIDLVDHGVIGEMAVLGADRRSASVQCKNLCVLQVLHGDVFNHILDQHPEEQCKFDAHVMRRLVGLNRAKMKSDLHGYDEFYGKVHPNKEIMKKMQEMFPLVQKKKKTNVVTGIKEADESPLKPKTVRVICQGIPGIPHGSHQTIHRPSVSSPSSKPPRRTLAFSDAKAVALAVAEAEGEPEDEDDEDLPPDVPQTADQMKKHAQAHKHDHDNDAEYQEKKHNKPLYKTARTGALI